MLIVCGMMHVMLTPAMSVKSKVEVSKGTRSSHRYAGTPVCMCPRQRARVRMQCLSLYHKGVLACS